MDKKGDETRLTDGKRDLWTRNETKYGSGPHVDEMNGQGETRGEPDEGKTRMSACGKMMDIVDERVSPLTNVVNVAVVVLALAIVRVSAENLLGINLGFTLTLVTP
jgi:hypothetical protein